MTHPLTDDICESLVKEFVSIDPDDMRAAADWQLEQCIAWFDDTDCLAQRMRKAMRPQEDS